MVWFKKRDHPDRLLELFGSVLSKHVFDLFWRAKLHLELRKVCRSPKKTTEALRGMHLFAVGQSDACQSPFARQISGKGHVLQCCQEWTPLLAKIILILGPRPRRIFIIRGRPWLLARVLL